MQALLLVVFITLADTHELRYLNVRVPILSLLADNRLHNQRSGTAAGLVRPGISRPRVWIHDEVGGQHNNKVADWLQICGRGLFRADVGRNRSACCSFSRRMEVGEEEVRTKAAWLTGILNHFSSLKNKTKQQQLSENKSAVATKTISAVSP